MGNEKLNIPDKNHILGQLAYSVGQLDAAEWHLAQYANLTNKQRWNGLKVALQTKTKPELVLYCLTLLIENSVLANSLQKDFQKEIDEKRATNEI